MSKTNKKISFSIFLTTAVGFILFSSVIGAVAQQKNVPESSSDTATESAPTSVGNKKSSLQKRLTHEIETLNTRRQKVSERSTLPEYVKTPLLSLFDAHILKVEQFKKELETLGSIEDIQSSRQKIKTSRQEFRSERQAIFSQYFSAKGFGIIDELKKKKSILEKKTKELKRRGVNTVGIEQKIKEGRSLINKAEALLRGEEPTGINNKKITLATLFSRVSKNKGKTQPAAKFKETSEVLRESTDALEGTLVMINSEIAIQGGGSAITTPSVVYQKNTVDNLEVYSSFPAIISKGIIYFYHGTGGSAANFSGSLESELVVAEALARGYGVVFTESVDRKNKQWKPTTNPDTNADLIHMRNVRTFFLSKGKYTATMPEFGIGMSNGGGFVSLAGFALNYKATSIHNASGYTRVLGDASYWIPTNLIYSENDSIVSRAEVEAASNLLKSRGVRNQIILKPEEPLAPDRLTRIPEIDATESADIHARLKSRGWLDASNYFTRSPESVTLQDVGKQYASSFKDIQNQLLIVYAEHKFMSDYKNSELSFFDASIAVDVFPESSCSSQKAASYATKISAKATELGVALAGSNFLGCDQRNKKNRQKQDELPSNLTGYDGVIFYNINGVNSKNTVTLPATPPNFMTAILQSGGGSHFDLDFKNTSKLGLYIEITGGGSNIKVTNASPGAKYEYALTGSGNSVSINGTEISKGKGEIAGRVVNPPPPSPN